MLRWKGSRMRFPTFTKQFLICIMGSFAIVLEVALVMVLKKE
jgi:hypothetical protein